MKNSEECKEEQTARETIGNMKLLKNGKEKTLPFCCMRSSMYMNVYKNPDIRVCKVF